MVDVDVDCSHMPASPILFLDVAKNAGREKGPLIGRCLVGPRCSGAGIPTPKMNLPQQMVTHHPAPV